MKGKIKEALKTKFKSLGFSDKAFEAVATMLEGQIKEESEIDTAIEGVEGVLKAFQGDADKRVTDAIKGKAEKQAKETSEEPEPKNTANNEDVPVWAKGLIDANKALLEKVNALEAGKTTETRKKQLEGMLAKAPELVKKKTLRDFERMNFEKDEDFETYLAETEEALQGLESIATQGAEKVPTPRPAFATKGKDGISTDTQAYIEARKAESDGKAGVAGKPIFQS